MYVHLRTVSAGIIQTSFPIFILREEMAGGWRNGRLLGLRIPLLCRDIYPGRL